MASGRSRMIASTLATTNSRLLSAAAAEDGSGDYVSPLQSLFDRMERNGPSSLGTTQPYQVSSKLLDCGVPEAALRFTTTSYGRTIQAPHVHAGEHRVVMKVPLHLLPLDDLERELLRDIVGDRYNVERNELRLTSDQFGSRIENKRHLVSMLDRIVQGCQRLSKEIREQEAG